MSCVDHGQVGVADPAVEDAHEHLAWPRRLDLKVIDDVERTISGGENSGTHALTLGGGAEVAQNPGSHAMSSVGGRDGIGPGSTRGEEACKESVSCACPVADGVDRRNGHRRSVAVWCEDESRSSPSGDHRGRCALDRLARMQVERAVLETVEHHRIGTSRACQFVEGLYPEETEVGGGRPSQHKRDTPVTNLGEKAVDRCRQRVLVEFPLENDA